MRGNVGGSTFETTDDRTDSRIGRCDVGRRCSNIVAGDIGKVDGRGSGVESHSGIGIGKSR